MLRICAFALWLLTCCVLGLFLPGSGETVATDQCSPPAPIQAELEKALAVGVADPFATEQALAPFRVLRDRYPENIFVQEAYQDAVQRYGIEGHLKSLTEEYAALAAQHDGILRYRYLSLRSLVGYSTPAAIAGLTEMAAQDPSFAPAHQTLAEIYGSAAFRDAAQEKSEREKLLRLCPQAVLTPLPPPLPGPSLLNDQAEKLLAQQGDPDRILAMTVAGIAADEWRWQHIHPHDWYRADEKRATLVDLRAAYWKAWVIQVRYYRRMVQTGKAADLLARMDGSAASFLREPGPQYWDALSTLVRLYAEGKQSVQATQHLTLMINYLAKNPDPDRATQLLALQQWLAQPGG